MRSNFAAELANAAIAHIPGDIYVAGFLVLFDINFSWAAGVFTFTRAIVTT